MHGKFASAPCPTTRIPFRPVPQAPSPFVKKHGSGQCAWLQIGADWDNGRRLMLSLPPDEIEIVSD